MLREDSRSRFVDLGLVHGTFEKYRDRDYKRFYMHRTDIGSAWMS